MIKWIRTQKGLIWNRLTRWGRYFCPRISVIFNIRFLWIQLRQWISSKNQCSLLVTLRAQIIDSDSLSSTLLYSISLSSKWKKKHILELSMIWHVGIYYLNLIPRHAFYTTCTMLTYFWCLINSACSFITPLLTLVYELIFY